MKKEDYIVYQYKNRRDTVTNAVMEALNYVYEISYPTPEKSFVDMCKDIKNAAIAAGKEHDENFRLTYGNDKKYQWPIDFFYVPQKVLEEVWDSHKDAAEVKQHWKDDIETLINFLYKEPGLKEVYSPTEYSNGKDVRHCESASLIKDVIGDDAANKLKDVLESYKSTYNWGVSEMMQFGWGFMSTPTCNRQTVIDAWKVAFNKDIVIPDDSTWIDNYEFEDKEYEGEFDNNENKE